jgi:E3 ubiquitin-protein ligase RNF181
MNFNYYYDNFFMNMMHLHLLEEKKVISLKGKQELKTIKYEDTMDNMCPITLKVFEKNEEIIQLPCKHIYKKEPIMKWLSEENNKCPVCRYELPGVTKDNYKKMLKEENKTILHQTFLRSITGV